MKADLLLLTLIYLQRRTSPSTDEIETHLPVDSHHTDNVPKRKIDRVTEMIRLDREHPEDLLHQNRVTPTRCHGSHERLEDRLRVPLIDSVQTTGQSGMRGDSNRLSIWTHGGQGPTATTRD
jgi:hypothetical protein